jgi:hypothetical protein
MGGFEYGECLENDTCQQVLYQQGNLEEVALQGGGCFSWNGLGPLVILHGNL